MPRKKSKNIKKSVSDMVSDITSSDILPIATSSPADKSDVSVTTSNLHLKEFEDILEATRKKLKEEVEKCFEEKKSEIINGFQELLSNNNLNFPSNIDFLKGFQKQFKQNYKSFAGESKEEVTENGRRRTNRTRVERMVKAIEEKENDDSLGETDEGDNFKENEIPTETNVAPSSNNSKGNKKLQFAAETADDDTTFKKPTGRSRRTTRATSKASNSYQTPRNTIKRHYTVAMVTPGPNSQKPVSILRRPNPGEMAISMTGSPLLIANNNIPVHVPQISIPLSDGRVMTVLANEGLDPDMSICSEIDSETQERLAVLQELLAKKTRKIK